MVNQNKMFSFKIKCQAKHIFPSDVDRTVAIKGVFKHAQNALILIHPAHTQSHPGICSPLVHSIVSTDC